MKNIARLPMRGAFSHWNSGRSWTAALLLLLVGGLPLTRASAAEQPEVLRKVGFDQRLNAQVPLDLVFMDENAHPVKLGTYFGKKPVILVLAYYECPMLCTFVLNGLVQSMRDLPFTAGAEFNVVTVSFNPRETPDLAAAKKRSYVASYGRPGAAEGWHFLTGKQDAIDKLTQAVGFRYVYDTKHNQYIHTAGIMILTPEGKISRYFYGIQFPSRDLRLGLVEASAGKIGSPTDQILLYCFHYDPETGKYTASILTLVRVGGVLTVLGLAAMVWFLLRRERRHRKPAAEPVTAGAAEPSNDAQGGGP
ncbi:MAG: SCO family protein [Pirellulales bacterium]